MGRTYFHFGRKGNLIEHDEAFGRGQETSCEAERGEKCGRNPQQGEYLQRPIPKRGKNIRMRLKKAPFGHSGRKRGRSGAFFYRIKGSQSRKKETSEGERKTWVKKLHANGNGRWSFIIYREKEWKSKKRKKL